MPELPNPKHENAVQFYVKGSTKKDAFIHGGYSYKPASCAKFFARPAIMARVEELMKAKNAKAARATEIAVQKAGLEESWILERLKYLTEVSIRGQPIKDATGEPTGKFTGKVDGSTAVACLRLASQIKGMLVHRTEVGDPGEFARLSASELERRVTEDMLAIGVDPSTIDGLIEQFSLSEESLTVGEA